MNELRITSFQRAERLLAVGERTPAGWLLAPLLPLSRLYGLAMRARAALYSRGLLRQQSLPCRVISVGNLTLGGTGKTPVVIALAKALRDRGRKVAVISRGYKRRSGASVLEISDGHALRGHPDDSGDEPFLIAQRCPGVPVAVGANRPLVGRYLVDRYRVDTVILDDGYQHMALRRDMDILVLDASAPFGNGYLVPRGRLREPLSAIGRASAVLVTRDSQGDLGRIRRLAEQAGVDRIVTTEKDAVKLAPLITSLPNIPSPGAPVVLHNATGHGEGRVRGDIWAVRIDLQWIEGQDEWERMV